MIRKLSVRARLMLGAVALFTPAIAEAGQVTGNIGDATQTRALPGA